MLSKLDFYSHNTFGDESQGSSMATHNGSGAFEDRYLRYQSGYLMQNASNSISPQTTKTAEKKCAILLSICRAATYQVNHNLTSRGKPTDHTGAAPTGSP